MKQLKAMLTSGLITLVVCLAIIGMVWVMTDTPQVQANSQADIISIEKTETHYLMLTSAPPQRDIVQQQLAPLAQ